MPEETMSDAIRFLWAGAALLASGTAFAAADADTQGGLKIRSGDGRYEFNIGGRIHLDVNFVGEDDAAAFGSSAAPHNSSAFFRRARLSFSGRAGAWEYHFTPDFAQSQGGNLPSANCLDTPCNVSTSSVAFQELYVARALGPGKLTLGQFIPFRSLEDQTSSNELLLMERAITSSGGVYRGGISRLFQIGAGYLMNPTPHSTLGLAAYNLRKDNSPATEGLGASLRATWAPLLAEGRVLHLGASGGVENPHGGGAAGNVGTLFSYAGIRGPTATLGATSGGEAATYLAAELAGVYGPFSAQGEVVQARYGQAEGSDPDQTTTLLYHVTLSWALTGETKPYDTKKGVLRSLKPRREAGALELALRHEYGENRDAIAATAVREVSSDTIGLNYYFSPNVRVMANYVRGRAERVDGQQDEPDTVALRLQMNW